MRHVVVNCVDAEVAETFGQRTRGLIGRRDLAPGKGMLITRCNCIHTCFMRFPIDATFLDRSGNAVKVVRNIRPWRAWVWGGWRAVSVLETRALSGHPVQSAPAANVRCTHGGDSRRDGRVLQNAYHASFAR